MSDPPSSGLPDPFALAPALEALLLRMIEQRPADPQAWAATHGGSVEQQGLLLALYQSNGAGGQRQQARRQRLERQLPGLTQAAWMPERIGEWQLVRPIGRGGMSWVFLARRERDGFSQLGALKLLPGGPGPVGAEARFANERAILAGLEHSAIARLIDGGVSDQGLPWLVMEWVDGGSLDEFCDQGKLDPPARLALVQQVLAVVQYAHGQLVVHRDLKPSNILVSARGEVKLLDFGIARVLDAVTDSSSDTDLTRQTGRLLSPGWASPEQVSGGPIGVASDIYSLGVLLYRLLTGLSPYGAAAATGEQALLKAVLEHAPIAPSKAVMRLDEEVVMARFGWRRSRLARFLRGDLDLIIMTCLRKEPARRYASVADLAADLQHHQALRPIAARRDHLAYTSARFLRRHRFGAVITLLVLTTLASGLALHTRSLTEARDLAEQSARQAALEAEKSGQIAAFLTNLFRAADPTAETNQSLSALDLVGRGLERIDELDENPRIQAEMLAVFADVTEARGRYREAIELYQRALQLVAELPAAEDRGFTARHQTSLATAAFHASDPELASAAVEAALAAFHASPDNRPSAQAGALNLRGNLARDGGRFEAAERDYRQAIALYDDEPGQAVPRSTVLINLGGLLTRQRRLVEARELFEQALKTRRAEMGESHPWTSIPAGNLASVMVLQGDFAPAEVLYRQALDDRRQTLGHDHPRVAAIHYLLGRLYLASGDLGRAGPSLSAADQIFQTALGPGHRHSLLNRLALAELALLEGESDRALAESAAVLQGFEGLHGQANPDIVQALHLCGRAEAALGRSDQALSYHQRALDMENALDVSTHGQIDALLYVAEAATAAGQPALAAQSIKRAAELAAQSIEPDPAQLTRLSQLSTIPAPD